MAERALASGNPAEAGKLAQESLQANEDPARAYFVLAKVASFNGDMQGAQTDFQKALEAAKDPARGRLVPHLSGTHPRFAGRAGQRPGAIQGGARDQRLCRPTQDRRRARAARAVPASDRQPAGAIDLRIRGKRQASHVERKINEIHSIHSGDAFGRKHGLGADECAPSSGAGSAAAERSCARASSDKPPAPPAAGSPAAGGSRVSAGQVAGGVEGLPGRRWPRPIRRRWRPRLTTSPRSIPTANCGRRSTFAPMNLYSQANNADKVIATGRKAIAVDPTNPIPLVQVASALAETDARHRSGPRAAPGRGGQGRACRHRQHRYRPAHSG